MVGLARANDLMCKRLENGIRLIKGNESLTIHLDRSLVKIEIRTQI
jgi:hypothetical protein